MTAAEEAAAQTELLENVIATAQRLVKAEKDKSKITPAYIAEKVKIAAEMFAGEMPVTVDEAQAVSTLIRRFSHWMGKATTLKDNTGHVDWLTSARKKDGHYWRRYRDFQESKLSDTVVDGLDETTDETPMRSLATSLFSRSPCARLTTRSPLASRTRRSSPSECSPIPKMKASTSMTMRGTKRSRLPARLGSPIQRGVA